VLFGLGISIVVAPLTTAVMTSVPPHNAGLASAINNAVSRVGPQLVGAIVFVAITASFYGSLAMRTHLDVSSPEVRKVISPLNRPSSSIPPQEVDAARQASTDAFHIAMLVSAGLLFLGAAINALGIEAKPRAKSSAAETGPPPAASGWL
jgi:hypothetical protein